MLILTLALPFSLVYIHAVIGIPVVLISALLGTLIIAIVVMATAVIAFIVWKRKSGMCTLHVCLENKTC